MKQLEKIQKSPLADTEEKAELGHLVPWHSTCSKDDAVISRQETRGELAVSSVMAGIVISIVSGTAVAVCSSIGVGLQEPLAVPVFGAIASALTYTVSYFSDKGEYAQKVMHKLDIKDKSEQKEFLKKLSAVARNENFIIEEPEDSRGNVKTWKVQKKHTVFHNVVNRINGWDQLLNDAVEVYDLREHALELSL